MGIKEDTKEDIKVDIKIGKEKDAGAKEPTVWRRGQVVDTHWNRWFLPNTSDRGGK